MSIEKKKVGLNMNHLLCTFHRHLAKTNRFRDRIFYVSVFGHKQHFRKKCPYCINALQQYTGSSLQSWINPSPLSNQEQFLQVPEENNYFEGNDIQQYHPTSFPYLEMMIFGRNIPSYLGIFGMNENHKTLQKLHYDFGRELFFSSGPLDFNSVSLVVSVVCSYLKCDSAARIFLSFGCVSQFDQNNKDVKFCTELRKLVEDILLRQKPAKSQYFSKQLLAFTYFLVQHVWQVCILCMGIDLKGKKQQQTEILKVSEQPIIPPHYDNHRIQLDTENEPEQECIQLNPLYESSSSKEQQVCQCNSLIQKGIWQAERRDWDQIPMKLLLSSELLTLLNLRYQQLNQYQEDLSLGQNQQSADHLDKETLIAYISCILQVKDSTFDFRRIHNLPHSIRNLVKAILKHPVNLSDSLCSEKSECNKNNTLDQYLHSLLLITESSIFIGFTIFAKQIEW